MNAEPKAAKAIFLEAVEQHAPEQWPAFLDRACAGQPDLRGQVEALLEAHREVGTAEHRELPEGTDPGPLVTVDVLPLRERPGDVIGSYKLLEQIGEGGFGVVFLAEQTQPVRRKVALKVLKAGMDTRQVVARFEAERQALAIMDHPHIAKVFDGGATPSGRPYFVMELVRGVPITKFCDQHHLTPRQRLELFLAVCQAVQHAHQKGIIHRDLKPSNVLVSRHDTSPVVKVIDFGVAKALGQELTDKTLFTGIAQMIGTPLYMSPEQAGMSDLDIDTRSDIYSLGVLLYELLTGTTPFSKARFQQAAYDEIRRIIREEEPPKPSTRISTLGHEAATVSAIRQSDPKRLRRLVRGELDWIVMKALEKDRARRYETASALAADLQSYLKDEPVEACPPSAWYRFRKFARRNTRALLTASVVALAVVLTASSSGVLIWRANQDLHQALDRERRGAYFQRIALSEREWAGNNLGRMEQLLGDCPDDLRGWEWRYLKRLRYGALPPLRHESPVYSVAFSPPDGQYLATATAAGVLRLWQAKTGQELRKWLAHETNPTTSVIFSPDGRYLASGGWDAKVKVWDVQTVLQGDVQAPRLQLEHTSRIRVWSVTFSPDGQCLVSAGGRTADEKGEVKVWDLNTRHEALTLSRFTDRVACVRFSPDGRRLATAGPAAQLWDAQTGQEQLTLRGHDIRAEGVAFSPDGRRLASVAGLLAVHRDQEVKVWDAQTGHEVLSLHGHVGALRTVAFCPDGCRLASAGLDQTVKLWDAATGQEVLTLRGHMENVFCVAFSPDGHQLASASIDKTVRIWDASPVEREPGQEYLTLRGHTGAVSDVAFHPTDGRSLASAGTDGMVRVWNFWSGEPLRVLPGPPSTVGVRAAYSPDGRRLAVSAGQVQLVSAGQVQLVRVWDVGTAKEICNLRGNREGGLCVAFSPDGRHLASAGYPFTVRVWDATTAQEVRAFKDHDLTIWGVAFSPDGRHLASCSADSTVRLWDWTTGAELPVVRLQHAGRVQSVVFSRDGKLLASASWDRTVKVWDTATWKLLHDLHDSPGAAAQCVAFGRDSRRLAWGSTDGTVKVWDGPRTETQVLRGHTSWVQAVAFSPDGKWIASASLDGTVKIWPAPPVPEAPAPVTGDQGK
jgi:WD40 repeat protein/serine/threonine protein kinase